MGLLPHEIANIDLAGYDSSKCSERQVGLDAGPHNAGQALDNFTLALGRHGFDGTGARLFP